MSWSSNQHEYQKQKQQKSKQQQYTSRQFQQQQKQPAQNDYISSSCVPGFFIYKNLI